MLREAEILRNLPIAVYATDAEGRITFYNEAAAELWGQRPELGAARWCGSWRLHWPDGRPMAHDECPMALTLRSGQPVAGAEAIAERPDGRRIRFLPFPSLVRDAAGAVTGAVNALVEVTDRTKAEIDLARLAAIVASSDDAIISKTLEGVVTSWNAGASRIFGYAPEEMIGQPILRIIPPELRHEEEGILAQLRRGERVDHFDTVRVAKDGRRLFISLTVSPIRNGAGEVVGASKVARDVSERKRSEELQRVLVDELNHRVRNTLATLQAIAGQSLRGRPSPETFAESFIGRVQALARLHDLLVQGDMQRVELADLVRELVDAGTGDARLRWSGPPAALDSHTAVQMALVLHELASNARRYGALSQPAGRLSVDWTVAAGKRRDLRIAWGESGVAALGRRAAPGFGTLLIERALLANGGETRIRYLPDGLACDIRLPLPDDALSDLFRAVPVGIAAPPAAAEDGVAGRQVLVVEDEPLIALDIEDRLVAAGCEVIGPAPDLETARRLLAATAPDCALLDANLAGRPVGELAAELTRRGIPFGFVSGYGRQALPDGFRDAPLLRKPFGSGPLIDMVRALLAGSDGQVVSASQR